MGGSFRHPSSLWEQESSWGPEWVVGSGVWTYVLCFPSPWNVPSQKPAGCTPTLVRSLPASSLFIVNKPWVKSDPGWNPGVAATSPPTPDLQVCCSAPTGTSVFTHNS